VHPTDEILLALAHGELDASAAEAIGAHCTTCPSCALRAAALRTEHAEIERLLRVLDHPVPHLLLPARAAPPRRRRSAVLAASLALLVAGAAAAAVPGTPVNRWLRDRLEGASPTAPRVVPATSPSAPAQSASGIELPASRTLVVAFAAPEPGGVVTAARAPRKDAMLRAFGGDVAYQVGDGRVSVSNRRPAGRYALEVPAELDRLTVVVAGRVVFDSSVSSLPAGLPVSISLSPEVQR
jgi:anti-sigma factor RsiW